jgi:hypothetical protein
LKAETKVENLAEEAWIVKRRADRTDLSAATQFVSIGKFVEIISGNRSTLVAARGAHGLVGTLLSPPEKSPKILR